MNNISVTFTRFGEGVVLVLSCFSWSVGVGQVLPNQQPDLPEVLLIGDSISIAYTPIVATLLKDQARISRPDVNCEHTAFGLLHLMDWLGTTRWDVIHFNFGIWDAHYLYNGAPEFNVELIGIENMKRRHSTSEYVANLGHIVSLLKQSGADLIWASTTPFYTYGEETIRIVEENNLAAARLMNSTGIRINDLYALCLPNVNTWLVRNSCHFEPAGNEQIARQVAAIISEVLKIRRLRMVADNPEVN